jgi:DNA-binding LacI/PurR family transcriptional regulator
VQRIAGFRAHSTGARSTCADSWFGEGGRDRSATVLAGNPAGIFACNDGLAEALIRYCRLHRCPLPALVGFDNAPIAEHLRLTTIGIPWRSLVAEAVKLVATRLGGGTDAARLGGLVHQPVLRLTT